jgi:hypothetical protein
MSNTTQTFGEALDEAAARVDRARQALALEEKARDALIVAALESGASFRDMGRKLNLAPATVLRRYGHKGSTRHVSALDLPAAARDQLPQPGTRAGASSRNRPRGSHGSDVAPLGTEGP